MDPKVMELKTPETEQIMESSIGESIMDLLNQDSNAPAPKSLRTPKAPEPEPEQEPADEPVVPAAKPAAKIPAKAVQEEVDPVSAEALAAATPKREDAMPEGLLKDEDVNKFGDKKQREAFIKERAAHKEARVRLQELTQRVQELQSKAADGEQVAALRQQIEAKDAELKKVSDEITKMDLTRSPEFKKRYDDRLNQLGGKAVQALVAEDVSQEEAVALIRQLVSEKRPSMRERAIDNVAPSLKGTVLAYMQQYDDVVQERTLALSKAKETAAAIDEAESRGRLAALSGRVDQVTDAAIEQAKTLGSPYYREVAGNDEWNAGVSSRRQALKGIMLGMDMTQIAPLVAEGLTAPDLRNRYGALLKQFKALEAEHTKVIGAAPRIGRSAPSQLSVQPQKSRVTLGTGDIADEAARLLDQV